MSPLFSEWSNLIVRWVHIIVAIMWIGDSLLFNWMDRHLTPPETAEPVEGELWMVHSGGFYRLIKKPLAPHEMPRTLHWFRWEAASTWISGFLLLWIVYYMGGVLVDADSTISQQAAIGIGLGTLVFGWLVYDNSWRLPLPKIVVTSGLLAGVAGVAYGLSRVLSGRAMFIHIGAMFGTIMVANVWMRILPAQRALIAATKAGKKQDPALAERAKLRSRHNSYLTYPVILTMISNHFPTVAYGSNLNWVVVMLFVAVGMGARYLVIGPAEERTGKRIVAVLTVIAAAALIWISLF